MLPVCDAVVAAFWRVQGRMLQLGGLSKTALVLRGVVTGGFDAAQKGQEVKEERCPLGEFQLVGRHKSSQHAGGVSADARIRPGQL